MGTATGWFARIWVVGATLLGVVFVVVGIALWLSGTPAAGPGDLSGRLAVVSGLAAVAAARAVRWAERRVQRCGLQVGGPGVRVTTMSGATVVPWADIEGFSVDTDLWGTALLVHRRNGGSVRTVWPATQLQPSPFRLVLRPRWMIEPSLVEPVAELADHLQRRLDDQRSGW
jgi:hypothetical protein